MVTPITHNEHVLGNPTIGVGFNLAGAAGADLIEEMGLNYGAVRNGSVILTDAQIDHLLDQTVSVAVSAARALVPSFDSIPEAQQVVLVDLAFNMGKTGLSKFVNMLHACKTQNWKLAASSLQLSAWFRQVGPKVYQRGGADVAALAGSLDPTKMLGRDTSHATALVPATSSNQQEVECG